MIETCNAAKKMDCVVVLKAIKFSFKYMFFSLYVLFAAHISSTATLDKLNCKRSLKISLKEIVSFERIFEFINF